MHSFWKNYGSTLLLLAGLVIGGVEGLPDLAGLFAVYATFQSDVFDRVASISGSLWFPDFREKERVP